MSAGILFSELAQSPENHLFMVIGEVLSYGLIIVAPVLAIIGTFNYLKTRDSRADDSADDEGRQ